MPISNSSKYLVEPERVPSSLVLGLSGGKRLLLSSRRWTYRRFDQVDSAIYSSEFAGGRVVTAGYAGHLNMNDTPGNYSPVWTIHSPKKAVWHFPCFSNSASYLI